MILSSTVYLLLFIMTKDQKVYPTEWTGGHHVGQIIEKDNCFYFTDQKNGKPARNSVHFKSSPRATIICKTKEEAKNRIEQIRNKRSIERGATKNQYRFINETTLEVKTTQDKTFFIDSKNKYIIDQNVFYVKKEGKNGVGIYTNIRDEKNRKLPFKLAKYIFPDYKIYKYNDGNGLNLLESNLSDITATEVITKVLKDDSYDSELNHKKLFTTNYYLLPKNKWILGKPSGTIIERKTKEAFSARIQNVNKQKSKQFSFKGKNKIKIRKQADKWRIKTSYELGQTKNLIKIISNDEIHVQITKDKIFKTDKIFIPLIQKYLCCALESKSTSGNIKTYVNISINNKNNLFHKIITGNDMTDHINGDTLDNRLCNLRNCTYSLNNQNKIFSKIGQYSETTKSYKLMIKMVIDGKTKFKNISLNKGIFLTEEVAKKKLQQLASKYKNFMRNFVWDDDLLEYLSHYDLNKQKNYIKNLIRISKLPNTDIYMSDIDINNIDRNRMIYKLESSILEYRKSLYYLYLDLIGKIKNNTK